MVCCCIGECGGYVFYVHRSVNGNSLMTEHPGVLLPHRYISRNIFVIEGVLNADMIRTPTRVVPTVWNVNPLTVRPHTTVADKLPLSLFPRQDCVYHEEVYEFMIQNVLIYMKKKY